MITRLGHLLLSMFVCVSCFLFLNSCAEESKLGSLDFLNIESDTILNEVFDNAEAYELQIRYLKIDRQEDGTAGITPIEFRTDSTSYFYPASTVKMPTAFLALEKLNTLYSKGIDIDFNAALQIGAPRNPPQSAVVEDSTALDNSPSIGHYVHKLFAVSDNDAYNRLYEFVGPEAINAALREKGIFRNSRIVHRVGISGFDPEENRHTNPFRFYNDDEVVYEQAAQYMTARDFGKLDNTQKGLAYVDSEDKKVETAFDFSEKNYISLQDLQESLVSVILKDGRFDLRKEDYDLLYKSMSILPGESNAPLYEAPDYYDGYVKFFMYGDTKEDIPEHIRIFNKVGVAYGYLTDCAYIVDFKNNIEFFLAATIHVNKNKTYNDGVYEYDEVGFPFLSKLGQKFYEYELTREREVKPDLSMYAIDYQK